VKMLKNANVVGAGCFLFGVLVGLVIFTGLGAPSFPDLTRQGNLEIARQPELQNGRLDGYGDEGGEERVVNGNKDVPVVGEEVPEDEDGYDEVPVEVTANANVSIESNLLLKSGNLSQWTKPKGNVLFIKIPKTGGTTLANTLVRLANYSGWTLARPIHKSSVDTCRSQYEATHAWKELVQAYGGKIDIFASHACYKPFMKQRENWSGSRHPHTISMIRDPWEQFVSKYRYVQACCLKHISDWCRNLCQRDDKGEVQMMTLNHYIGKACSVGQCNAQWAYLAGNANDAADALDAFDQVLLLERFDEGLALLRVKLGMPFRALPYLSENKNVIVPMPEVSDQFRKHIERTYLYKDIALYRAARARFENDLQSLNSEDSVFYNSTLSLLKVAHEKLAGICNKECEKFPSLTIPRKFCDMDCTERILDNLTV